MATKKKPSPAKPKAKAKKPASNLNYAKPKKVVKKSPRPQALPGMEDRAVETIETMARDYADIRDERIQLNVKESQLKSDLMTEMKRLKKDHYKRDGVEITIIHEKENLKVKVKAHEEDSDDEPSHEEPDEEPETNDEVAEPEFEPAEV